MSERPVGHESCLICQDREEQPHPCGHEAEIASLRTQVETLTRERDEACVCLVEDGLGPAEDVAWCPVHHGRAALIRHLVELGVAKRQAERERDTASRLQQEQAQANLAAIEHHMARAEAAEAKLAEAESRLRIVGRILQGRRAAYAKYAFDVVTLDGFPVKEQWRDWKRSAETAEEKLAKLQEAHVKLSAYYFDAQDEERNAKQKLAELVAWRRGLTSTERGWVMHRGYAGHTEGTKCTLVYGNGSTECGWIEAHKGELETEATSDKASG